MRTVGAFACLWLTLPLPAKAAAARPRIELTEFRIEPLELPVGESFTVHARATATGVKLGSFILRTADDVQKEDIIPGFPLYANGRYCMAENGRYFLFDNGKLDGNPDEQAFSLPINTRGWKEGVYAFAFFASCRPSDGPFVAARRDFAVTVKDGRLRIEDLGQTPLRISRAIARFAVQPTTIKPGEPVTVIVGGRSGVVTGVQFSNPFHITQEDRLPGFQYDETTEKSYYPSAAHPVPDNGERDRDRAADSIALEWNTADWPAGVHHLRLDAMGHSGKTLDYRTFAIKVRGPTDRLEVTVTDSRFFAEGTHFGRFVKLQDGTLLCEDQRSTDYGRTWQASTGGFGTGAEQLRDGRILGLEYRCFPREGRKGHYTVQRFLSLDGGRRFEKTDAHAFVPEAKAAMGHGPHYGPLFMRSIVEREDGSLVGLFAGWFHSDTALCPYGRGRPYSRTYVCQSNGEGISWDYLTTIGYDRLGSEGYNEGSMRRLPDGRLLAVIRTGNERDPGCQDNPIMWSESRDEGRTWSPPRRTGLEGAYPSLAVLSDGQLVMSYGRPGAMIAFSADNGRTWTDRTAVDATPYSGYTDVVEIGPGKLLIGFGAKEYLDSKTGIRDNQLRLAEVHYVTSSDSPTAADATAASDHSPPSFHKRRTLP